MISEYRSYIESRPAEVLQLQELAKKTGIKVFVEVNEDFPSNFIDTFPFLVSICERLGLVPGSLKAIIEDFAGDVERILIRLVNRRYATHPYEVTTSFLLIIAIAQKYSKDIDVESLKKIGWHEEVAQIVLGNGG